MRKKTKILLAVLAFLLAWPAWYYLTFPGSKLVIVIPEDQEEPPGGWGALTSPDGRRVAYRACSGKKCFVVLDGVEGPKVDAVGSLVFSSDGRALAYVAEEDGRQFVVSGERRGATHGQVAWVVLSPDGTRVAYTARAARESGPFFLVVGDEREPLLGDAGRPAFSPDGRRVAYQASTEEEVRGEDGRVGVRHKRFIVVDGRKGPEFAKVSNPVFSPDSSKVAYCAGTTGATFIMVNEEKGPELVSCENPAFRSDGTVAYVAYARDSDGTYVQVGDRREPSFPGIHDFVFSPDGKRLAYYVILRGEEDKCALVLDGVATVEASRCLWSPVFSANGRHVAYMLRRSRAEYLGADSKIRPAIENIGPPVFVAGGEKVGFLAMDGRRIFWKEMSVP
jgi:hypothetical protein